MPPLLKTMSGIVLSALLLSGCQHSAKDHPEHKVQDMTVTELKQHRTENQPLVVVDIREDAFFNGWPVRENIKTGHIKGAINFQPDWLILAGNEKEQLELLTEKGITPDNTIVVYCNTGRQSKAFYQTLRQLGYNKVYNLKGGIKAWGEAGNDTELLTNYQALVYPQWLHGLIEENSSSNPTSSNLKNNKHVLLEVGYDEKRQYVSGHIPGAIYLDTRNIEWNPNNSPSWNYIPDNKLAQLLAHNGIDANTTVIIYSDKLPMATYRTAVAMLYAGVKDVRVLNGGKQAWKRQGYALEQGNNLPTPLDKTGSSPTMNEALVINIPEAKALLANPDGILASVMTPDEFYGKKSGYSYYDKASHIPGAVLLDSGKTAYDMLNYEDIDGTLRAYTEIEALWKEQGITPEKAVSFYCGTGWRASEAFFAAYLMGWENISVFDDGWVGWSMDPDNPIATKS